MFLKRLKLTNFRNYPSLDFEFTTPLTILLGNNAQGKSNFLESIYLLATTKSPKADRDEEIIKNGEETLHVEAVVLGDAVTPESSQERVEETVLQIAMQRTETGLLKRVKVNGIGRRVVDYIGNLTVVSFSPEDINLVTGSPSLRRWHIDLTLAQIDREYKTALTNYEEVVVRKNKLLKMIREGLSRVEELDFWLERQVEYGKVVTAKRLEFFTFLNSQGKKFGDFRFDYLMSEVSKERLSEYQSREIASATSLVGPHRDDFIFKLEDRDLSKYGSRGEHRTAVLDLKISEASFVENKLGNRPILLLDDVFSELDNAHKAHVVELVRLQQTVIAGVDLEDLIINELPEARIYRVKRGGVTYSEIAKPNEKAGKLPRQPKVLPEVRIET